jgi:type I restriction enzyme S subunit
VKWNQIEAFPLLLPPLTEQGRIVDAIKEIFTRLDVIEPALEGLLERLGVLRSAILADTFHANRDLPDGWEETTLEDLAASAKRSITDGPFGSNLKTSHYTDSGPRVIRLQNIGEGCFIDVHAHISEDHYRRLVAHNVLAEDLVVASLFSDRFRSCLIPEHVPPAIVKADCIRIRLSQEINPRFVNYALMRPAVDAYAVRSVHGVGRSRLGMKGVKSIPVPLPPHAEQQRIVEYIDAAFSRVDALDAAARSLLKRIGVFRQSILAEAFAGRLVSQDPADEPASAFLERIQADRETGPKKRGKVKA